MGYRLSKIVTKKGDDGTTQVEVGKRISKDDPVIHALGDLDELNSLLGIVLAYLIDPNLKATYPQEIPHTLHQIQQDLFNLGGELCPPHHLVMTEEMTQKLEEKISHWNKTLPPLKEFILPSGNAASTHCHLARTVCRRVERSLVHLHQTVSLQPEILRYIN